MCGSMTSGGTESILTAVKASRWAWGGSLCTDSCRALGSFAPDGGSWVQ